VSRLRDFHIKQAQEIQSRLQE